MASTPLPSRPGGYQPIGPGPRRRLYLAGTAAIAAVAIGLVVFSWPDRHAADSKASPAVIAPSVSVATVTKSDLPIVLQALGTVTPVSTVAIKSQISGYLSEVAFKEGQMVRKGEFLAQIDPRPYEASLAQFQGQLLRDQSLLRNARLDLARYQRLIAQDSTSRQTVDTASATVSQYEGIIQSDQAQIDMQKLNLIYCHIVAPTDGLLGLRQIDAGNFVQASDPGGLVLVTQIQPISIIFTVPQTRLDAILKRRAAGATVPVSAYDSEDASSLATGTLETIDNQIDTSTGTVKLRALFPNQDRALFPNQFVNAHVLVDVVQDALTIPTAAVRSGMPGTYVYAVRADHTVAMTVITTGAASDGRTMVLSGLALGDQVVVDGIDRLNDGMKVSTAGTKP
jgi:multidrug efflux system membrane fusion protein